MFQRFVLLLLPLLIALTSLSCTSNGSIDRPDAGGAEPSVVHEEGEVVDYHFDDFAFDEEQDSTN